MPQPEFWLRGPITNMPEPAMPVAHTLHQALEDLDKIISDLQEDELWLSPGGAASPGFHLLHIAGSLDRLFTYARDEKLSEDQLEFLRAEKKSGGFTAKQLSELLSAKIQECLDQLRQLKPET